MQEKKKAQQLKISIFSDSKKEDQRKGISYKETRANEAV